uniref:Protein kinase domain-containing protein n=1 Tax=Macrostomum lignano TaxID=282301 RepID=A0A1I8F505_9PLAT
MKTCRWTCSGAEDDKIRRWVHEMRDFRGCSEKARAAKRKERRRSTKSAQFVQKNKQDIPKELGFQFPDGTGQGGAFESKRSHGCPTQMPFAQVLLAERRGTSEIYAVKISEEGRQSFRIRHGVPMTEKRVLALPQKPSFLVQMHSCFRDHAPQALTFFDDQFTLLLDRLYFVMEFRERRDLMYRIQQEGKFKEPVAAFYAAEIAVGLFFLHSKGILYRDLKLDNVLLDNEGHIKIADFGMCKENPSHSRPAKKRLGCTLDGEREIREHVFFRRIDWNRVENREVQPPYLPTIQLRSSVHRRSGSAKLTPTDKLFIMNLDQTEFSGFSYVNPEFIVEV